MITLKIYRNTGVRWATRLPGSRFVVRISILLALLWADPEPSSVFAQSAPLRLHEIHLSAKGSQRTVLFRFSRAPDSVRSFTLSSPPRLVIDVTGPVQDLPSGTYQAQDTSLAQVRTGSHPHRLRLVLDLKGQTVPRYSVDQQKSLVRAILEEPIGGQIGEQAGISARAYPQVLFSLSNTALASQPRHKSPVSILASSPPPPTPAPLSPKIALKQAVPPQPLPQEAHYHLEQGQILYDAGKVDEAIFQWQEAVRVAPHAAKAYHLLGVALRKRGQHSEAVSAFEQALSLEPDNATAQVQLARAFEATGDAQAAWAAYRRALELVPSAPYVHNRLGHLAAAKGDWQTAINEWQQTVQLAPTYAYAHAHLGEALEKIGQKREALAVYERAIPVCPRFAQALKKMGKKQQALTLCAQIDQRVERLQASGS